MFKKFKDRYVQFVQRILVTVFLTLIYFLGFGITAIFIRIFRPSILENGRQASGNASYWLDARKEEDLESCKRQS